MKIPMNIRTKAPMKNPTKTCSLIALLALACMTAGPLAAKSRSVTDADAPRGLPAQGAVSVDWTDPAEFSEIRYSHNRQEARRGNWVEQLALHLQSSAVKKLPRGETLQVTLTDIKRAGEYEPWRGHSLDNVRIVRDLYPPRIDLTFTRLDASGNVMAQGQRKLTDAGFLLGSTGFGDGDPLRYEKSMLDRWLRRELMASGGA